MGHTERWGCAGALVLCHRKEQKFLLVGEKLWGLFRILFLPVSFSPSQPSLNTCHVTGTRIGTKDYDPLSQVNPWLMEADSSSIHQKLSQGVKSPVDTISVQIWSSYSSLSLRKGVRQTL